jgi:mRNA interferase RelE/StbE
MARYELRVKPSVAKDLQGIPKPEVRRALKRMESPRADPRPPGCEKLSRRERHRVRQGVYRIVYSIDDMSVIVEVVRAGHRGEVYQGT